MEFEIFYKGDVEDGFPSPFCEFMIRENAPGGRFVESYFKCGQDMLDYIDRENMLVNNHDPFPISINEIF